MRILTVVHDFLPRHFAGAETMSYLIARGLQERGHELLLLFAERDTGREAYSMRAGEFDGLPFREVAYDNRFEDYEEMYADPSMRARFIAVLEDWRPDLVHFQHTAFFGVECLCAAAERGIPSVATLHDYYLLCPRGTFMLDGLQVCSGPAAERCGRCMDIYPIRPERYGCPAGDVPGAFTRALARRAQRVAECAATVARFTSPSRFLMELFEERGAPFSGKIDWIRPGLPPLASPLAKAAGSAGSIVFGYAGTLVDYKGVDLLVRAFRRVDAPEAVLEIHGELAWFPEYVARLRSDAGGDARIRFMGAYDPREAHAIHARFDALVVPSLWYENAPVSIMEARRQGLPVIATDLGGMAEAVRDGVDGLLFARADEQDLARKLRAFAASEERREALAAGVEPVRPAGEMVADYEALFSRVLISSGSGAP